MTTQDPPDTSAAVLVLHSPSLDPYPFLARLTKTPESEDPLRDGVPWAIDNKYYSANVVFRPHDLGSGVPRSYPVMMYLFEGQPSNPLPASLTRLSVLDPPPDISLAIRVKSNASYGPLVEDVDERFDELGMEVIDELGDPDDDDERPIDSLDVVRQTLMTHMWPNMRRKAQARRDIPRPDLAVDSDEDEPSLFPVSFSRDAAAPTAPGPVSDFPTLEPGSLPPSPREMEGYAPLPADGDDFGDFTSATEPDAGEYARLDAWLDEDEDEGGEQAGEGANDDEADRHIPPSAANGNGAATGFHQFTDADELPGFEDDFGPMATQRGGDDPILPLDPTPLLLHLQQVRADLSAVEDEDERRRRAAEEVTRVMAGLGFGGADWDDPLEGVDDGFEFDMPNVPEDGIARLDRLDRMDAL